HGRPAPAPSIDPRYVVRGPQLSQQQIRDAAAIASRDKVFRALLGSRSYTISSNVPRTAVGSNVVFGDELTARLSWPLSGTFALPAMHYGDTAAGDKQLTMHEGISNATSLVISVNLETRAVVSIEPDAAATVTDMGNNPHVELTNPNGD